MKIMKNTAIMMAIYGMTLTAHAATISWSGSTAATSSFNENTLSPGLFSTTGTLIEAQNLGGAATTFDGISFAAGTQSFGKTFDGFHDSLQELSKTGTYNDNGAPATINLTGLVVGHTYSIQALIFDGRGDSFAVGRTVSFDGLNLGTYANGVTGVTWGTGLLATGNFTADSTTQSFTVESFSGASSNGGQLNAFTLHQTAIPEASSLLLGVLGSFGLLRRNRRA
jgi:hypothetical protein